MAADTENFVIQTFELTKIFRDFWGHKRVVAVDALNLKVRNNEVYGLLGPNGSGKSTTIKMLLGLLFPTRGAAKVLGNPPGNVKTNALIGYLPEDSHLYPFLSARETLDFYGRLFGLSRQERRRRIDSLLNMVGLAGVGRRPVGEFSKGMARRIGLAQALINDPDLLILDEPTAGLDPIGTRQIKDLIRELGARGKTVLLCSHLLADVEDVCDRIGILYGGKMHTQGPVEELLARRELTQISVDQLDGPTISRIKQFIRQEHPHYHIEISTPRDRLEDFFLRTVAQAQAAELETSGAVMGTGVSDFLSTTRPLPHDQENVIEQLVEGSEPQLVLPTPAEPSAPPITAKISSEDTTEPLTDVLESLVDPKTTGVVPLPSSSDSSADLTSALEPLDAGEKNYLPPQDVSASKIDKSVIENLLGKPDHHEDNPSTAEKSASPAPQENPDRHH